MLARRGVSIKSNHDYFHIFLSSFGRMKCSFLDGAFIVHKIYK